MIKKILVPLIGFLYCGTALCVYGHSAYAEEIASRKDSNFRSVATIIAFGPPTVWGVAEVLADRKRVPISVHPYSRLLLGSTVVCGLAFLQLGANRRALDALRASKVNRQIN